MKSKKGQLSMGDAPTVVLIVGFVFLVMATMAYIGSKYGDALDTDNLSGTTLNESVASFSNSTGNNLLNSGLKNVGCSVIAVQNATGGAIVPANNYTVSAPCKITADAKSGYALRPVNVSYTYSYSLNTQASNVTGSLETEIANNTSIAGIVLTISLVGIVLSILIGIFMAARRGGM